MPKLVSLPVNCKGDSQTRNALQMVETYLHKKSAFYITDPKFNAGYLVFG